MSNIFEKCAEFVYDQINIVICNQGVITTTWENTTKEIQSQIISKIVDISIIIGSPSTDVKLFEKHHNDWVNTLKSQGWVLGDEYDFLSKTHNKLKLYEDLNKEDKELGFLIHSFTYIMTNEKVRNSFTDIVLNQYIKD